jgi:excisionase family DNA binding protein
MPNLKPLLSVDEAAVLLGASRASLYRSIERGDLPLPVFKINGRLRIARRAVERLLAGEPPHTHEEGAVKGGEDGERSERTLDGPAPNLCASHNRNGRPPCGRPECPGFVQPKRAPTCSAARRSSSGTPSV